MSKKSIDELKNDIANLLVNYGQIGSKYDLVLLLNEIDEPTFKDKGRIQIQQAYVMKLDDDVHEDVEDINPPESFSWIGYGNNIQMAIENLFFELKSHFESDDEEYFDEYLDDK